MSMQVQRRTPKPGLAFSPLRTQVDAMTIQMVVAQLKSGDVRVRRVASGVIARIAGNNPTDLPLDVVLSLDALMLDHDAITRHNACTAMDNIVKPVLYDDEAMQTLVEAVVGCGSTQHIASIFLEHVLKRNPPSPVVVGTVKAFVSVLKEAPSHAPCRALGALHAIAAYSTDNLCDAPGALEAIVDAVTAAQCEDARTHALGALACVAQHAAPAITQTPGALDTIVGAAAAKCEFALDALGCIAERDAPAVIRTPGALEVVAAMLHSDDAEVVSDAIHAIACVAEHDATAVRDNVPGIVESFVPLLDAEDVGVRVYAALTTITIAPSDAHDLRASCARRVSRTGDAVSISWLTGCCSAANACIQCGVNDVKLKRCKRCLHKVFCGFECYKKAWKRHKLICKSPAE
jgi:hypothetical protein